jgi:hypothetical protein
MSIGNIMKINFSRKATKENEKAEVESRMTEGVTQMREKEKERDFLRNKLKETRGVESQVNELRTTIKKNEATRKMKLQDGKNFSKDKEQIIERSKASALFMLPKKAGNMSGKLGTCCQ